MDPTHPRTPTRRYQVPFRTRPRGVEEDVPGSFQFPCLLCPHPVGSLPRGGHLVDGEEGGWIRTFSRVEWFKLVVSGGHWRALTTWRPPSPNSTDFGPSQTLQVYYYALQTSQIFGLPSSLSVLKDLTLTTTGPDTDDVLGFNAPPPAIRPPPCSLVSLTSAHIDQGWDPPRVGCWTYRTVLTSGISRCHNVVRKISDG